MGKCHLWWKFIGSVGLKGVFPAKIWENLGFLSSDNEGQGRHLLILCNMSVTFLSVCQSSISRKEWINDFWPRRQAADHHLEEQKISGPVEGITPWPWSLPPEEAPGSWGPSPPPPGQVAARTGTGALPSGRSGAPGVPEPAARGRALYLSCGV